MKFALFLRNALVLCAPLTKCGPMLEVSVNLYKMLSKGDVFSAFLVSEDWRGLRPFCFVELQARCVKTCRMFQRFLRRRFWKLLFTSDWGKRFLAGPNKSSGCSTNFNLIARGEHEIVSKRILGLLFFSAYAFARTLRDEQISSNFFCIFGWVSMTRLKFNASFCWSIKIVIEFWSS